MDKPSQSLDGVAETLLITLYTRARATQRPDGMIRDNAAVEIVKKMGVDLSRLKLQGHDEAALIMRLRYFDQQGA